MKPEDSVLQSLCMSFSEPVEFPFFEVSLSPLDVAVAESVFRTDLSIFLFMVHVSPHLSWFSDHFGVTSLVQSMMEHLTTYLSILLALPPSYIRIYSPALWRREPPHVFIFDTNISWLLGRKKNQPLSDCVFPHAQPKLGKFVVFLFMKKKICYVTMCFKNRRNLHDMSSYWIQIFHGYLEERRISLCQIASSPTPNPNWESFVLFLFVEKKIVLCGHVL